MREVAIEKLGYPVDHFHIYTRMTLIHTVARYRTELWDEEETAEVQWLIKMSDNLLITNNFGRNPMNLCKVFNPTNLLSFETMIIRKMRIQMSKIQLVLMKRLQEKTHQHRYVVREIYKYVDG